MTHVHTGHGPDSKLDCEGCEDEYHDSVRLESEQRRAAAENYAARLDEAEEKLAFLAAGCMWLTRDELIRRITEIGPARWKAGIYWQQREDAAFKRGWAAGQQALAEASDPYPKATPAP